MISTKWPGGINRSSDLKRPIRCMAILDQPPGDQFKVVRQRQEGFAGWLVRAQDRLNGHAQSGTLPLSPVRGSRVAMDYVLEALLMHSENVEYTFVVPDSRHDEFRTWLGTSLAALRKVQIVLFSQLNKTGLDQWAPDIWLNIHGDNQFAFRLRDQLSKRVYPTVTLQHGLSAQPLLYDKFFRTLIGPTYECDSLICTSHACRVALHNILDVLATSFAERYSCNLSYKGRLDTIPLCIDTDYFCPGERSVVRRRLKVSEDDFVMLYMGYLSQTKAELFPILPILTRLIAAYPDKKFSFLVAGTGEARYVKELVSASHDLGVSRFVRVMQNVSDSVKLSLFQSADVFVAPCESLQESFGLTPVEAMSCGLPQIVADWSAYRETVVDGETGYLIPTSWASTDDDLRFTADLFGWGYDHAHQGQSITCDLELLYGRLNELVTHVNLRKRMGEASRARAMSTFSPVKLAQNYERLWRDLISTSNLSGRIPGRNAFDNAEYMKIFGHFATRVLSDDCQITISQLASISVGRLEMLASTGTPSLKMMDSELTMTLIRKIQDRCNSGQACDLVHVIEECRTTQVSAAAIRRHIILLAKAGQINLIQGGSTFYSMS